MLRRYDILRYVVDMVDDESTSGTAQSQQRGGLAYRKVRCAEIPEDVEWQLGENARLLALRTSK